MQNKIKIMNAWKQSRSPAPGDLKKHQKPHQSQTCKICGKSFYQTTQLVEHIYTHVKTPPKTTEASVDCQLINLNTTQVEHRDRTLKEDSLTTYRIMTPDVLNMDSEMQEQPQWFSIVVLFMIAKITVFFLYNYFLLIFLQK